MKNENYFDSEQSIMESNEIKSKKRLTQKQSAAND